MYNYVPAGNILKKVAIPGSQVFSVDITSNYLTKSLRLLFASSVTEVASHQTRS